jgi:cytidylate kinase
MKPVVVGFSGRQASGKTMLSREIASRLDWPRVSFGDYVRSVAGKRGISEEAGNLQDLGADLIHELGWEKLCRQVLAQVDWSPERSLVIDGIRHTEALTTLTQLVSPTDLVHVHIKVSDLERQARLTAREEAGSQHAAQRSEDHSTEIQALTLLPRGANLVINGDQPFEENVRQVLDWIHDRA